MWPQWDLHFSQQYGHVILVGRYLVLTAAIIRVSNMKVSQGEDAFLGRPWRTPCCAISSPVHRRRRTTPLVKMTMTKECMDSISMGLRMASFGRLSSATNINTNTNANGNTNNNNNKRIKVPHRRVFMHKQTIPTVTKPFPDSDNMFPLRSTIELHQIRIFNWKKNRSSLKCLPCSILSKSSFGSENLIKPRSLKSE